MTGEHKGADDFLTKAVCAQRLLLVLVAFLQRGQRDSREQPRHRPEPDPYLRSSTVCQRPAVLPACREEAQRSWGRGEKTREFKVKYFKERLIDRGRHHRERNCDLAFSPIASFLPALGRRCSL